MSTSNILTVPLRRTDHIALTPAIRAYIEQSYDQHPDMFKADITELERLRNNVVNPEVRASSITNLMRYFIQLTFLSSKFPADIKVNFVWYGTLGYSASASVCQNDLQFERANILYNIGAMYSQLGFEENRSSGDGLKHACQSFQLAAGCFTYLKQNVITEMHMNPPDDISAATLDVLTKLMLAQAQECFWQKAVLDNIKNSLIARLAHQVSEYYDQALNSAMRTAAIKSEWIHHFTCKKYHFEAAAQYRAASDCLSSGKYGEELARLKAAQDACVQALADAKYVAKAVADDLKGLQAKLKSDYARAEKDNDLIYLAPVPSTSALPAIKTASTVEALVPREIEKAMDALQEKYGPPLFAKLVPFAAHQAASIYVDRRDTLVHKLVIAKMDALSVQLHDFLARLGLPGSLQALERPVGLPPSLAAHAEEIRASGGYVALQATIEDVRDLSAVDSTIYVAAADVLRSERQEDEDLRARHGTNQWHRAPSVEAGAELYAQLDKLGGIIKVAADSDEVVRAKFREHESTFRLLSGDLRDIEEFLPKSADAARIDPELELRSSELRQKMNEVSKVEYRRRKFVEDVKEKAKNDDVSDLILQETARLERLDPLGKIEASQFEKLFTERLKMYEDDKKRVADEADEQTRLLTDIELADMDFSSALAKSRGQTLSDRESALQKLEAGYFKYQELMNNLEEGRKFYNDFSRPLTQFQDEVNDFVYSRRVEARELDGDIAAQFDRLTLGRTESPLPAPRPQGLPPPVLSNSNVWNPSHGIQFGRRA
ncbi:BRO1-like domain-containing protein [Lipomyces orientalis]|uniref:BRO1-like domain-containing protein n=1 Tax=Lipomyces orientalis TaxID=1233043 RepID=A0ACC3TRK1_9ASCO